MKESPELRDTPVRTVCQPGVQGYNLLKIPLWTSIPVPVIVIHLKLYCHSASITWEHPVICQLSMICSPIVIYTLCLEAG